MMSSYLCYLRIGRAKEQPDMKEITVDTKSQNTLGLAVDNNYSLGGTDEWR